MDAKNPAMRAGYIQDGLKSLVRFGPEKVQAIRKQVPAEILKAIEDATKVDWLPVGHDVAFTEAMAQVLGDQGVRELSRDALVRSFEGGLVGPFIKTTIQIFGLSPLRIIKLAPQFWQAVYRDCGRVQVLEPEPGRAQITFTGLPAEFLASPAYRVSMCGAVDGVMAICRVTGKTVVEEVSPGESRITLSASWTR